VADLRKKGRGAEKEALFGSEKGEDKTTTAIGANHAVGGVTVTF